MATEFIPWGDRMLVRPTEVKQQSFGLSRPDSEKEKPTQGVVLAVGEDLDRSLVNRTVHWNRYSGREIVVEGEELLILRKDEANGEIREKLAAQQNNTLGELPERIREDSPYAICSYCGRKTWDRKQFDKACVFPYPLPRSSRKDCPGIFSGEIKP